MREMLTIVTSRGRPDRLGELLDGWRDHARMTDLLIVLDEDDLELDSYYRLTYPVIGEQSTTIEIGPRLGHAQSLNNAAVREAANYRIIGQMGDDHRPRTPGWDRQVASALTTTGIAYGDDLYQGPKLPTAVWMTTDIIDAVGQFVPRTLWHLYIDNYWLGLGLDAGCLRYLPGVVLEHMHPDAEKALTDQTYAESNSPWAWSHDGEAWAAYVDQGHLAADAEKVRALIDG